MANFYPRIQPVRADGIHGECDFWKHLHNGLSSEPDFDVFYNVTFRLRDSELAQKQIDFLVTCRKRQVILNIEVKGGSYGHDVADGWWKARGGSRQPDYPGAFVQAEETIHKFKEWICHRVGWNPKSPPFGFSHVVALPHSDLGRPLPPEAEDRLIEARVAKDPAKLRDWINRKMDQLLSERGGKRTIEGKQPTTVIREAVRPSVEPHISLATIIASEHDSIDALTSAQQAILDTLEDRNHLVVSGYAGTGKTVVAEMAAIRLSEQFKGPIPGPRVLFLCFNRNLAEQVQEHLSGSPGIKVSTFHELCRTDGRASGLAAVKIAPDATDLDRQVAAYLTACSEGRCKTYDAVIVDEAQDFKVNWLEAIRDRVVSPGGKCWFFYDPLQALFRRGEDGALSDEDWKEWFGQPFTLRRNMRNTTQICDWVKRTRPTELARMQSHKRAVQGVTPKITHYQTHEEELEAIESRVLDLLSEKQGILPRQIVLLSPWKLESTSLHGRNSLAQLPLVNYRHRRDKHTDRVLCYSTLQAFKGCEADVVILHDVSGSAMNTDPMSLYVAASRARFALYVYAERGFVWPADV